MNFKSKDSFSYGCNANDNLTNKQEAQFEFKDSVFYGCDINGNLEYGQETYLKDLQSIYILRREPMHYSYILDNIDDYKNISISRILFATHDKIGWELGFFLAYWLVINIQKAWAIQDKNLDVTEFFTTEFFVQNPVGVHNKRNEKFADMTGMFFTPEIVRSRLSSLFILKLQNKNEIHYILNLDEF